MSNKRKERGEQEGKRRKSRGRKEVSNKWKGKKRTAGRTEMNELLEDGKEMSTKRKERDEH